MNTDDLPAGPKKPDPRTAKPESTRFEARGAEALGPFHERLRGQEFALADLVYRPKEKAVDLLLERRFPPDKGTWALRIAGVESWLTEHQAIHEKDTIRDLRIEADGDAKHRRVVLRCVLDTMTAVVTAVDLRLVRLGADQPSAVQYRDLPEWFRAEVQVKLNAEQAEEERIVKVRMSLRWLAYGGGAVPPVLLGLFTGGGLLPLLFASALIPGPVAWWLASRRRSPQFWGAPYGLAGTVACVAGGALGSPFTMFFPPLLLLCWGIAMGVWINGTEDLKV